MTTLAEKPRLLAVGDSALAVEFGNTIDPALNRRVHALAHALGLEPLAGVLDWVPTYRSLLVRYDPLEVNEADVLAWVQRRLTLADSLPPAPARRVEVPTVYGGRFGPDLDFVARHSRLSPEEVIDVHSRSDYIVYMMGFTPGYPYLGKVDPAIAVPRLEAPRPRVPAGSVGLAGPQTGIYPIDSPGGWRIIGYTPLRLFDLARPQPFLFAPGDTVRFLPIREADLDHVAQGH